MITLKLRSYSTDEIALIDDMLADLIHEIKKDFCPCDCKVCKFHHLCLDLHHAQVYTSKTLTNRQG